LKQGNFVFANSVFAIILHYIEMALQLLFILSPEILLYTLFCISAMFLVSRNAQLSKCKLLGFFFVERFLNWSSGTVEVFCYKVP